MWTPKGKRKIYPFPVPPLYPTSGYRNRAVEWNDFIFFNNNTASGANLAKVDALALPEETSITLIAPDVSYPVPNESVYNWTLTNISDDTFVLSGYYGKGFTRISINGEIVADADLVYDDLTFLGVPGFHNYIYFPTIAQYNFNGTIIASSSNGSRVRCLAFPATNPQTTSVTCIPVTSTAIITHIYGLNDEIYLGNMVGWETIILNPDLSISRTIAGSCYTVAEELESSYYVVNPLPVTGTIYDIVVGDAVVSRRVYGSDTEVAEKTITDGYIVAIADPHPAIPFFSILYCDGFPIFNTSRKVVQVDKETLDTLHVWDIPDSVGIDVRHGCIDSLGYTYFPVISRALTGVDADKNVLRIPPPPATIPYNILLHFNSHPFINSGTLPTTQTSSSSRFTNAVGEIIFGSGSLLGSLGNGTSDPNPLQITTTNSLTIASAWTIRTKFILNSPSGIYTGLISFWAGSGIGSVSINSSGSIIVMQFSSAISCSITVGSVQELAIELFSGVLYIYIDGTLVGSQPYNDPLSGLPITGTTIGAGGTIFNIGDAGNALVSGQQTVMDEFIFVNGTALAGGASSYVTQVSPYLP